jgi:pimeloyl-ACP methyl ester carboxylesterase
MQARGRQVSLADGRHLGFAEWGDPEGIPVLLFHGIPGSRLFRHPDETLTCKAGVRLLTIDRPGIGFSDVHAGRTLRHVADDAAALADLLRIDTFAVAGVSGGGPYALACGNFHPGRITRIGLISSLGHFGVPAIERQMREVTPWLLRILLVHGSLLRVVLALAAWRARRNPERFLDFLARPFAEVDRQLLVRPDLRALYIADTLEVYRHGGRGHADDICTLGKPWDFMPEDIRQRVLLWHGEEDRNVPVAVARLMAEALPQCDPRFYDGAGHLLLFDHWVEILTGLAGRAGR